jgi:hypothetical protein
MLFPKVCAGIFHEGQGIRVPGYPWILARTQVIGDSLWLTSWPVWHGFSWVSHGYPQDPCDIGPWATSLGGGGREKDHEWWLSWQHRRIPLYVREKREVWTVSAQVVFVWARKRRRDFVSLPSMAKYCLCTLCKLWGKHPQTYATNILHTPSALWSFEHTLLYTSVAVTVFMCWSQSSQITH